jgi:hypothetical protein
MIRSIIRKTTTALLLVKEGKLTDIVDVAMRYVVRITKYRLDVLDVNTYVYSRFKAKVPLDCMMATDKDMILLFEGWQDSEEELKRHYEVYFTWQFKKCFLYIHKDTREVLGFCFLLTYDDRNNIALNLPKSKFRYMNSVNCADHEWLYTFEKYRQLGIILEGTDYVVKYCRDNGIDKLYSQRGYVNLPSIKYADKIGYCPIGTIYHIQLFNQKKNKGIYLIDCKKT